MTMVGSKDKSTAFELSDLAKKKILIKKIERR